MVVGSVVAVALVAVAIAAIVRGSGGGAKTVQTVGGQYTPFRRNATFYISTNKSS